MKVESKCDGRVNLYRVLAREVIGHKFIALQLINAWPTSVQVSHVKAVKLILIQVIVIVLWCHGGCFEPKTPVQGPSISILH